MKTRLLEFIDALRVAGLPISVTETLDAMQAVAYAGVSHATFREALAATVVKDEADRPTFDAVFDRFFAAPSRVRKKNRPGRSDAQHGAATQGRGGSDGVTRPPESEPAPGHQPTKPEPPEGRTPRRQSDNAQVQRLGRRRTLHALPFRTMSPRDVEECTDLVAELARRFTAHLRRRQHAAARTRIDIRRTIRRSLSTGGVPLRPAYRQRSPGKPDLVVLCDCSHSVTTASRFLCSLIAPAAPFFRRTRLFGYVDTPVELSIEGGHLVPHGRLDLYGRSDFGKTLASVWEHHQSLLTRNSIVLILGDARNNRRPPRRTLLQRIRRLTRRVIWLNPDEAARWNTGDSVIAAYEPHCDAVLAASCLRELLVAVRRAFRQKL